MAMKQQRASYEVVVGPVLTVLAIPVAVIPKDSEGLSALVLVCTLLILSALIFISEWAHVRVPVISRAARLVLDRALHASSNWKLHTARSLVETVAWLCVSMQLHRYYRDVRVSAPLGAVFGFGIVVVGDLLTTAMHAFSRYVDGPDAKEQPRNEDPSLIWREEEGVAVLVPRVFERESRVKKARKGITMAEVAKHCTREDAWICVEGRAYDVTKYVEYHPGGWLPIANLAGKDVTDAFANYHPASVYEKLLPNYYIGDVVDYKVSEFVSEHRALRQELLRRGEFETRPSFYLKLGVWLATLYFSSLYMTIFRATFKEHMVGAFLLACFWQQIAFFGHDIGHNAVSHQRKRDLRMGIIIGNITGGISLAWWKRSHNVHHVVCNSVENDPDNQHIPVFAVDRKYFGKFFSTYHQKYFVTDAVARALVSVQHFIYYPVMAVARFNLYAQGILLLLSKEKIQYKKLEIGTILMFWGWMILMLYTCLGSWQERVAYLLVSHGVAGLLHVQITLSHFAEEVYHGQAYNNESDEWFRMQVKTTLNIDCAPWMDWFHGGLQFQIEHHLWPRLPRHNLRKARDLTKALCAKHSIQYNELDFFRGNLRMLGKLRAVALEARNLTKGDGGFFTSALYEGAHAIG